MPKPFLLWLAQEKLQSCDEVPLVLDQSHDVCLLVELAATDVENFLVIRNLEKTRHAAAEVLPQAVYFRINLPWLHLFVGLVSTFLTGSIARATLVCEEARDHVVRAAVEVPVAH